MPAKISQRVAYAAALLIPMSAHANLLTNGDFSSGPPTGSSGFATVTKGQSLIPGWKITRNSVDYNTGLWQNPTGTVASIDMNGSNTPQNESTNQPGTMSQKFKTAIGTNYTVVFYLSGNPSSGCGPVDKKLFVKVAGVTKKYDWNITTEGNTLQNMQWTPTTFTFSATSAASTLAFLSKTSGYCGPTIGNVSVDPS